jgi:hypothetical protein
MLYEYDIKLIVILNGEMMKVNPAEKRGWAARRSGNRKNAQNQPNFRYNWGYMVFCVKSDTRQCAEPDCGYIVSFMEDIMPAVTAASKKTVKTITEKLVKMLNDVAGFAELWVAVSCHQKDKLSPLCGLV